MVKRRGNADPVRIVAYPRVHLSLLSLHQGSPRIFGGVGFALQDPQIEFRFTPSRNIEFADSVRSARPHAELTRVVTVLQRIRREKAFRRGFALQLRGAVPPHSGFGSGTMFALACVEALGIVNGSPFTRDEIVAYSGRGRTSGIGVNTYFDGGLVMDLGHKHSAGPSVFLPSERRGSVDSLPLLALHVPMPKWQIGICFPKAITPLSEADEVRFFRRVCPIPAEDSYEATYHALFGIVGSVLSTDFRGFCGAVNELQRCTWKRSEIGVHGGKLENIIDRLYRCGAEAVGMSSLGPVLFFLASDCGKVAAVASSQLQNCEIYATLPRNRGRVSQA
jgi:beta-ribofuranosylaminobenzene 5'-phosphate synthase